jgi:ubiquinone biosynthesis protein COQ4
MNLTANPSTASNTNMSVIERLRTVANATRAALADPEDTSQVFRIAEALTFGSPERMLRRFRGDADGARLLTERDDLLPILRDRDHLAALPEGSLGRAYLGFLDSEGITADGLVEASMDGTDARYDEDDDLGWMRVRMRDSHDLWHTVTGYQGDLLGEASLLAFTFAQTRHPGIGFLAALGAILNPNPAGRRMILDGYRRGKRAAWLPARDWAALLARPLDEVRRELGVEKVPDYEPIRETPWAKRAAARAA